MAKGFLKTFSSNKVKLFLMFLILASIFWVLTKFSREFTSAMTAKVDYKYLPNTATLAKGNTDEINFDLTANGFEILFYKFKKPSLEIRVDDYYTEKKDSFSISKSELLRKLSGSFNKYMEVKNLSPDHLNVKLDPIVLKKVLVKAKTDISFKDGFKPIDDYIVKPDSITISGPKGKLENIDTVYTEVVSLKNIEKNISESVKIKSPSEDIVAIDPISVKFQWPVAEFSQGQFTLPVEIVNLPPGMELKLVPERITVSFDVAIDDFGTLSADSFRVICDYSKRNKEENFMLPELSKKPEGTVNIMFQPKKVDFFIFK
jgi:hypothetical protein